MLTLTARSSTLPVCTASERATCNCPSDVSCCPSDGACFQNPSDVQFTTCKTNPASACSMSGTGGGGTTPPPPPTGPAPATRLRITSNCTTPIDLATGRCTAANGCMTSESCRAASDPRSVVHTGYVSALHARCPSASAFSYDDANGLHACPSDTSFEVTFCP